MRHALPLFVGLTVASCRADTPTSNPTVEPVETAASESVSASTSEQASSVETSSMVSTDVPTEASPVEAVEDSSPENAASSPTENTVPTQEAPSPTSRAETRPPQALPKPIYGQVSDGCGRDPGVGSALKPFRLQSLDGKTVGHRSYRNRVLLVNFWGSWCKPCLKELPEFDRLYRRYRKYGLTLIAIATDEDPSAVQPLVEQRKLAAKVLLAGEEYAETYESSQFPFTFVVDTEGTIVGSFHGYRPECMGALEAEIRDALEERNR